MVSPKLIVAFVDSGSMKLARLLRVVGAAVLFACPSLLTAQQTGPAPGSAVTLLPGDAVLLKVWRMEDMSGEFLVDESGIAILPLLGPRKVTDVPIAQVRESLYREFRAQLNNPSIEITPLRRVYVLGEVRKPGVLSVDPTITLAGAVALAEGPTENGDLKRIHVIRAGQTVREKVGVQSTLANIGIRSGDQIFIGERSWLYRNSLFLANLVVSVGFTLVNVLVL